jgi:hypothetical protein
MLATLAVDAGFLQAAMQNKVKNSDATQVASQIEQTLLTSINDEKHKNRLVFGVETKKLKSALLTTSVVVEDLHRCYLSHWLGTEGR